MNGHDYAGDPGPDHGADWWHQMDLEVRRYLEELTKRGILTETERKTAKETEREHRYQFPDL
jgi:hypothetical protein